MQISLFCIHFFFLERTYIFLLILLKQKDIIKVQIYILKKEQNMHNNRYHLLDTIRGFAIINMILYHLLWDVNFLFGYKIKWYLSHIGSIWQQAICITFIFISGFCFSLGRHQYKRGFITCGCAVAITVATYVFMPKNTVLFGVLCLIGSCTIITKLTEKYLKKLNCYIGFGIFTALFVILKCIGLYGFPKWLYKNIFTAYIGFPPLRFASADYFPLVPWLFLFVGGYYAFDIFKNYNIKAFLGAKCPPLEFLGRHSLVIYMLHQPVIYLILLFVFEVIS